MKTDTKPARCPRTAIIAIVALAVMVVGDQILMYKLRENRQGWYDLYKQAAANRDDWKTRAEKAVAAANQSIETTNQAVTAATQSTQTVKEALAQIRLQKEVLARTGEIWQKRFADQESEIRRLKERLSKYEKEPANGKEQAKESLQEPAGTFQQP